MKSFLAYSFFTKLIYTSCNWYFSYISKCSISAPSFPFSEVSFSVSYLLLFHKIHLGKFDVKVNPLWPVVVLQI